ncbi:MAG: hypothetical protein ACI83W_001852 [Marinoscillum sp.]|jgi:hypothetical protein
MPVSSQAFMIYKEELAKERIEKQRLQEKYDKATFELTEQMKVLKERLSSQQQMMESALNYAIALESQLEEFKDQLKHDQERNSSGFH